MHLILHTGRLLDEKVRAGLSEHGLHQGQARVLDALLEFGTQGVTQIATELEIAQPTATVMLKRMEDAGLVSRSSVQGDARMVLFKLTRTGRTAAECARRVWVQVHAELDQLIPGELQEPVLIGLSALREGLGGRAPAFRANPTFKESE
jgi:DNA-binding MarR family transcriptional regulator